MQLRAPKAPIVAGMLTTPSLRQGVQALGSLGLLFQVWLYHTQLGELLALARACPGTTVVIDHLGGPLATGPYMLAGARTPSSRGDSSLAELAACHNVVIKFSGLGMRVSGLSHGAGDAPLPASSEALAIAWRPWFEACLEAFGASRVMFGSNFPIDKGAFGFGTLWNAFKRLSAGLAPAERDVLLASGTAARVYGLHR